MGRDKTELRLSGETLLQHTATTLSRVLDEILIAGLPPGHEVPRGARTIPDAVPGIGPLGGLLAGLRAMRHPYAVAVACDLPFLDASMLAYLLDRAPGSEAVVPVVRGRPQPAHAVYSRGVIPTLEAQIASGTYALRAVLQRLQVRWVAESELRTVDPKLRSFVNVNTPAEWEDAVHRHLAHHVRSGGRSAEEFP